LFEEEKDIRRVALNSALKTQGKTKGFDEQSYREFLDSTQSLGGSTRYLDLCEGDATDADALEALETDEAVRILSGGQVPPREGVVDLMQDTLTTSTQLAVCNARWPEATRAELARLLGAAQV